MKHCSLCMKNKVEQGNVSQIVGNAATVNNVIYVDNDNFLIQIALAIDFKNLLSSNTVSFTTLVGVTTFLDNVGHSAGSEFYVFI